MSGYGQPRFTQCLDQALNNGGLGLAFAERWHQQGGETAALHCLAFAHQTRGDGAAAGAQFQTVASRLRPLSPELAATALAAGAHAYGLHASALADSAIGTGGGQVTRDITERAIAALETAFGMYETALTLDPRAPETPTTMPCCWPILAMRRRRWPCWRRP